MERDIKSLCAELLSELDADALVAIITNYLSTDDLVGLVHDEVGYDESDYPELEEWHQAHC